MKRRNVVGINPRNLLTGDLVLFEGLEGRKLCIFLGWHCEKTGRAKILDEHGFRGFWFEPPENQRVYEKWWIVGKSDEVPQ